MNLLEETKKVLAENGKSPADVRWVGRPTGGVVSTCLGTWDDFAKLADKSYNNGFGGAEVCSIYVVGDDWWLERGEYDGSEWWEFKTMPRLVPDRVYPAIKSRHVFCD